MLRRDRGHVSFDRSPIGGYQHDGPNFPPQNRRIYEGNRPIAARPNPARFLLEQVNIVDDIEQLLAEPVPDLYEGQQLGNEELPIHEFRETIKETIKNNPITIIVGGTGSGKSTQVPQFLLEAGFDKVYITQPRRIASYGVASRIEDEIAGKLGEKEAKTLVGYQTAEKSSITSKSKIAVITDGIEAVRSLNDDPIATNEVHIVDEVHERNTNIDLTLAIMKRKVKENPNIRFVLTTATLNKEKIAEYCADAVGKTPPIIEVPGRPFNIEEFEKPDSTVATEIMECLHKYPGKSMLVFLAGKREISDTMDKIYCQLSRADRQNVMILPLHAKLPKEQQDRINIEFKGTKIILATNVAQTSVTIPDADIIIDSAEERRVELDDEGVEGLAKHPISQSDVIQRKGRTGRVRDGIYIRTRYNEDSEFMPYHSLIEYPTPEILRSDPDRTTLRTAAIGIHLEEFDLIDPLEISTIDRSKESLRVLKALDHDNNISTEGLLMNRYPIKPSSARMVLESMRHSPLIQSYMAAITASIEVGGLPYFAPDVGREWQNLTDETSSDLLAQLDIFIAIQNVPEKELTELNLDVQNVKRAQELYEKIVRISHSYTGQLSPPTLEEKQKLKECIYPGLLNYLYERAGRGKFVRVGSDKVVTERELSNRSIVTGNPRFVVGKPYRVEYMKSGEREERHIIEQVTEVDNIEALGRAAMHLCKLVPDRIAWSKERPVQVFRKMLFGVSLGEVSREAKPSAEVRQAVINKVLDAPGEAQKALRTIKKELERLQNLTKQTIPQLTQETLLKLIDQATPDDIIDPWIVDLNLGQIIEERDFYLDSIISPEDRQKIDDSAPREIFAEGITLRIAYSNGQPIARNYNEDAVAELEDEVYLEDGRQVLFAYTVDGHTKEYTLTQLRQVTSELISNYA